LPGVAGSAERLEALELRAEAQVALFPRAGPAPWQQFEAVARLFGVDAEAVAGPGLARRNAREIASQRN
jgi:hypothetical protein